MTRAVLEQLDSLVERTEGLMLEEEWQLRQLLDRWRGVFARDEEDHECTDAVHHHIPTVTAVPIRERYQTVPQSLYPKVR